MLANPYAAPGRCHTCGHHLHTPLPDAGLCINKECAAHETWQDIPRAWKFGKVRSGLTRVPAARL